MLFQLCLGSIPLKTNKPLIWLAFNYSCQDMAGLFSAKLAQPMLLYWQPQVMPGMA
jgi:hypothetical protein